ncbi:hypothetical protein C8N46_104245 [Kordia periserrulae]|uniref:DNA topoisomerase IV n=1 Tax=Kordia periserrulae TaxID=701523 RepID=A0A2T6BZV8_9FLAO|nr:hypothetical protein [Kordia periserrulae]PTX61602.1 hypothetical protein C8N46_104245 [Kordia periserrulae]
MKNYIFSICILIVFSSCYQAELNCNDFKTGTFEFTYEIDGVTKTGKSVRTDTLSIDYYDNKIDTFTIRWVNECEFIGQKLRPLNYPDSKPIQMKILSTTENSYLLEYNLLEDPSTKKRGTVIKLN